MPRYFSSTHRIHEGEEAQTRPIALQLRELRPVYDIHEPAGDLSGQSAGSHELLFESREASLELDSRIREGPQPGRVRPCRRRVVGDRDECAAEAKAARARTQKVELDWNLQ